MFYDSKASSRLINKTILITGASSGIGKQTAIDYAKFSNGEIKLILIARRLENLINLKNELEIKYLNIKILIYKLDISNILNINEFFLNLPKEFSNIDILINNAGKAKGLDKVGEINQNDIDNMFQTNVIGMISITQHVLLGMKERNKGDIVQLGSIAGRDSYPGGSIYCATKASLRSFTSSLRKELISTNIRVIEIDPGNVETEFSNVRYSGDFNKAKNVYKGTNPLIASDISDLILFTTTRKENTVIAETLIFASNQASSSHIHRTL